MRTVPQFELKVMIETREPVGHVECAELLSGCLSLTLMESVPSLVAEGATQQRRPRRWAKPRRAPGVPPELADHLVIMRDVCVRLNCSKWTVYRLIERGELARSKKRIGNRLAITKKSLDAYTRRIAKET